VVTLYVSPGVTMLVVVAGIVLMLLVGRNARAAIRFGQQMTRVGGEAYRAVMEHLGSIKMAKSYGAEERSIRLFGELTDTVAGVNPAAGSRQSQCEVPLRHRGRTHPGRGALHRDRVLHTPTAVILLLIFAFARVMPLVSGLEQGVQRLLNMLPDLVAVLALEE